MNRKIIILSLIFSLALIPCFSANGNTVISKLTQQVILKADESLSQYDIGFCKSPINTYKSQPNHYGNSSILLKPIVAANGETYAMLDPSNDLYVYWRLSCLNQIEIKLRAKGAMVNSVNGSLLPWTISWTYDKNLVTSYGEGKEDSTALNNDPSTYKTVALCKKLINLQGVAGSVKIDIHTNSLLDVNVPFDVANNRLSTESIAAETSAAYTTGVYKGYIEMFICIT